MLAIFPELVSCAEAKDIERLALLVRKYFAGEKPFHPRIHVGAILECFGVQVEMRAMSDQAILCVQDDHCAIRALVLLNEQISDVMEKNFLLGHVLGYFLLYVQPKLAASEWRTSGLKVIQSPARRFEGGARQVSHGASATPQELAADQFAASLLMPRSMVLKAREKLTDLNRLASFFQVSETMMVARLAALGEVTPPQSAKDALLEEKLPAAKSQSYLFSDKGTVESPKGSRVAKEPKASASPEQGRVNQGLERIRKLARRIDDSV